MSRLSMPCRPRHWHVGRHSTSPGLRLRTFAAHAISGYRRKPSGKKPRGGTAAICFLGDGGLPRLRWRCSGSITSTRFPSLPPSIVARRAEAPMACIIWQGTQPSGSKTGLESTTMRPCRIATPVALPMADTRWCEEDRGRVPRLCCERPPEGGASPGSARRDWFRQSRTGGPTGEQFCRISKAVQQGRSERRDEAYASVR